MGNSGAVTPAGSPNWTALQNVSVSTYVCPSSVLPVLAQTDPSDNGAGNWQQVGNYVAIMGASTSSAVAADPTGGGRVTDCSVAAQASCEFGGYLASNGVTYPGSKIRINEITDGTSNTLLVGEQSAYGTDPGVCPNAGPMKLDMRTALTYSIWVGAEQSSPPTQAGVCGDSAGSTITLRWPIGTNSRQSFNDGMGVYCGFNKPLLSAHTGGVNVLLCDGSVQFFSVATSWNTTMWMAIRDDGQTFAAPD